MFRRLLISSVRAAGKRSPLLGAGDSSALPAGLCLRAAATSASRAAAAAHMGHAPSWARIGMLLLTGAAAAGSLAWADEACAAAVNDERTFIMIKPDGVHRGLIADIIKRFEQKGFKLVGIKVLAPTKELAGAHYEEHAERPFFPKLVDFLSSGAVVAMVWEGKDVIKTGRQMIGATNPLASAPGTIRGDYGVDVGRNVIHGSDSLQSAQREIVLWFKPDELAHYELAAKAWIYE